MQSVPGPFYISDSIALAPNPFAFATEKRGPSISGPSREHLQSPALGKPEGQLTPPSSVDPSWLAHKAEYDKFPRKRRHLGGLTLG